tara:strand:- start:6887 stop:7150 length:264 start_codon:yes stop_codon:yes gene_type:complete
MLTEVFKRAPASLGEKEYSLREILVNPQNVSLMREDNKIENEFREGRLPTELDKRQKFTRIHLSSSNSHSITVVGDMLLIRKKLTGC